MAAATWLKFTITPDYRRRPGLGVRKLEERNHLIVLPPVSSDPFHADVSRLALVDSSSYFISGPHGNHTCRASLRLGIEVVGLSETRCARMVPTHR